MSNGNNTSLKPYDRLTSEMFDDYDAELGEVDSSLAAFAMPDGLTLQERSARQATQRELRNRAIETALLAAGTQALSFRPTSIQREQAEELAELQRQQEAGEAALDPDVRNLMDRAGAAAGRLATQLGQQFESTMAAGGGTSAADIRRVQGEESLGWMRLLLSCRRDKSVSKRLKPCEHSSSKKRRQGVRRWLNRFTPLRKSLVA